MKFRILTDHYWNDVYIEEGTIVGDGTSYPMPISRYYDPATRTWIEAPSAPSMHMEPLDDEAREAYVARMAKLPGGVIGAEAMAPPKFVPLGQPTPGQGPKAKAESTVALNLPGQGPRTATGAVAKKG